MGTKRSAHPPPHDKDEDHDFQAMLAERAAKHPHIHDYGRYTSLPNDPNIKSALGRYRRNQDYFLIWLRSLHYLHLIVQFNGCSVILDAFLHGEEVVFGIVRTFSDLMMYKISMNSKQITSEL